MYYKILNLSEALFIFLTEIHAWLARNMKMTYLNVYLHCFVIDELIFIPNPMCQIYKFLLTHDEKKTQNEMPHIGEFSVDT